MLLQITGFLQNIDNFYALLQTLEDFYIAIFIHSYLTYDNERASVEESGVTRIVFAS